LPEYLNGLLVHVLHSEVVKSQYLAQALGSTVAHINVGDVKRFAIPVPPLAEQLRVLTEVDCRLSIIREIESEVDASLLRAQALRQATLSKAFGTGQ
jgi:type I restriction enzyme S subunit